LSRRLSFTRRLTIALALLLLGFGALVGLLGRHVAAEHEQEALQRLSHGLARHIVEHWPEIILADPVQADLAARKALLSMLMAVNPGIQVYLLDADGRVRAYIGEPGMVRTEQVAWRRCAISWRAPHCPCAAPTRWAPESHASSARRCFRRAPAIPVPPVTFTWCSMVRRVTWWPDN